MMRFGAMADSKQNSLIHLIAFSTPILTLATVRISIACSVNFDAPFSTWDAVHHSFSAVGWY